MCRPPGAIRIWSGTTRSPSSASLTVRPQWRASRSAKTCVKPAGMCCTTRIGGTGGPRPVNACPRACGPPVEMPITTRSVAEVEEAAVAGGELVRATAAGTGGGRGDARSADPALGRGEHLADQQVAEALSSAIWWWAGLGRKSKAPSSSASRVTAAPSWVRALTITTGASWTANRAGKASRPDIPGISTSSVITSGLSCGRGRRPRSRPWPSRRPRSPGWSGGCRSAACASGPSRRRPGLGPGTRRGVTGGIRLADRDRAAGLVVGSAARVRSAPTAARRRSCSSRLKIRSRSNGLTMKSRAPSRIASSSVCFWSRR